MKFFLILVVFFSSLYVSANPITATKTTPRYITPDDRPVHPIVRPPHRPIVKPAIIAPVVVYEDNYYTTNVENSCQQYINQISDLNKEIVDLKVEIERLKAIEAAQVQSNLREKHEKEMLEFESRKSSVKTKNSINITSKP